MADEAVVTRKGLGTSVNYEDAQRQADALVRGAIDILTRDVDDPNFTSTDIKPAKAELDKASANRDATNLQIGVERDRYNDANAKGAEAITAKGQADADNIRATADRAAKEAQIYTYYSGLFGVNQDPNAPIADMAAQIRKETPVAMDMLKEIQEMQSVGILDNPLEYLVNQLQLPSKTQPYNALADRINAMQGVVDKSIKTAQDASNLAARGIPTITAAQADAQASKAVAQAEIDKNKSIEELAKTNVSFAVQRLSNDLSIAGRTEQMTQLEMQQNQQEYAAAINKINSADTHATRMLRAAELMEKIKKTEGLDVMLANYDRITGHPLGTTTRYTFERFGEPHRVNTIAIGAGSVGVGPVSGMLNFTNARPGPLLSPETNLMFNYVQDLTSDVSKLPEIQRLDEKQKLGVMDKQVKELIMMDVSNAGKFGGMFFEMSPAKMIASDAIPAGGKLAQVLAPYTKQTGPIPTEMVIAAISKEYPNPTEAGQVIAEYYRRNMKLRNESMNSELFGIKLPIEYKVKNAILTLKPSFDLTKPEEATKYILFNNYKQNAAKELSTFGRAR